MNGFAFKVFVSVAAISMPFVDVASVSGFAVKPAFTVTLKQHLRYTDQSTTRMGFSLLPSSSILTAVEVFDGSTIVDPVVVSGVFWANLQGKLLSVVIGQIMATVVFGLLASLATSQLPKLGQMVSETIFKEDIETSQVSRRSPTVEPDLGKLFLCITIDVIGTSSELIPIVGELSDVVWAPIAALALRSIYGSNILFILEFAEEILPLTDILPLATLCWVVDTFFGDSNLAKALGLGIYSTKAVNVLDPNVIDVTVDSKIESSPTLRLPSDKNQ